VKQLAAKPRAGPGKRQRASTAAAPSRACMPAGREVRVSGRRRHAGLASSRRRRQGSDLGGEEEARPLSLLAQARTKINLMPTWSSSASCNACIMSYRWRRRRRPVACSQDRRIGDGERRAAPRRPGGDDAAVMALAASAGFRWASRQQTPALGARRISGCMQAFGGGVGDDATRHGCIRWEASVAHGVSL